MTTLAAAGLAALGLAASLSAASAQDRFSGGYAGLSLGANLINESLNSAASCPATAPATCYFNLPANLTTLGVSATGSGKTTSVLAGAQLGANFVTNGFLIGGEADIQTFNSKTTVAGAALVVNPAYPGSSLGAGAQISSHWLATMRARLGVLPTANSLVYVTGGVALTSLNVKNLVLDNSASFGAPSNGIGESSVSSVKTGTAFGFGGEYAFDKNWSLRGEFLHVNFGSVNTTANFGRVGGTSVPNAVSTTGSLNANIVKMGVNYKF